jgi:predicted phage terminase large subunit-like protein
MTRAMPLAAQCEARNVKLVRGAWNAALLDELTVFPQGKHDDQVDALSGAFAKLARPQPRAGFSYQG